MQKCKPGPILLKKTDPMEEWNMKVPSQKMATQYPIGSQRPCRAMANIGAKKSVTNNFVTLQ